MSQLPQLEWCLGGYALLTVLCVGAVTLKYRTIFHPLLFPGLQLFVMACVAPWAQDRAMSLLLPQSWWIGASLLTALYLFGLTWPMLTKINPLLPVCESLLGPWELARRRTGEINRQTPLFLCRLYAGCLAAFSAVFFALLIRDSSAGTLWLTDPRTAYMFGRSGSGHWYVLSQTCWFLSYLCWLYYGRPRNRVVMLCGTLACVAVMSYFGSKAAIVGVIVAGGVYFNYFVRTFSWGEVALAAGLGVPVVLVSPWLQGNFDSLKETLQYYDYFDNAARYVGRDDQFGPLYGGSFLSSLWEYVPRRLVPDKPYVYGTIIVNEYFYEGAAKTGYTPGYLPWIAFHVDFNIPGVFIGASLLGFVNKAIYTYFLRYRSFLGFLCFLQVSFIPVLKLAPILYFVALLWGLAVTMRLFLAVGKVIMGIDSRSRDLGIDVATQIHTS
jgi:hypothetical protein